MSIQTNPEGIDPQTILAKALQTKQESSAPKHWERTDSGNANVLRDMYKGRMYFSQAHGWLVWQRGRWQKKSESQMLFFAKKATWKRQNCAGYSDEPKKETAWAIQSRSIARLEAASRLAKSLEEFQADDSQWDSDLYLFGVANGVIDLRTGKLRKERPEDFILHHSSVNFDPDATCARFNQFLEEVFGKDSELISYVQRAIGYSLTGDISEQVFFACHGSGANGKSTFLNVLTSLFGEYSINLPFAAFETSHYTSLHDLVELPGRRFATASESRDDCTFNEQRLKMLTGGDPITVRRLYHEQFTFFASHKLWLAFNSRPDIRDNSTAMWRRIREIPFEKKFAGKNADPYLAEKLRAELSGILNWAVQGCRSWQRDGLRPPEAVTKATAEYQEETDEIGQFIAACLEVSPNENASVASVWQAYLGWCKQERIRPLGRNTFNEKLRNVGFQNCRKNHGRLKCWKGLKVRLEALIQDNFQGVYSSLESPKYESKFD